jgi:hypothetical protein
MGILSKMWGSQAVSDNADCDGWCDSRREKQSLVDQLEIWVFAKGVVFPHLNIDRVEEV